MIGFKAPVDVVDMKCPWLLSLHFCAVLKGECVNVENLADQLTADILYSVITDKEIKSQICRIVAVAESP